MAYNLSERFSRNPKTYRLLEPGAYQNTNSKFIHSNKEPFLAKTPRKTIAEQAIWTHAMYYADKAKVIPNCTSILSKTPRFTYESLNNDKQYEAILCQCGEDTTCDCHSAEKATYIEKVICQAKVPRRIFKGRTPRSILGDGLSSPCRRDQGFKILQDGSKVRILKQSEESRPPFYDVMVEDSNEFYRGWKWSKWSSQRGDKTLDSGPGPADYNIENGPNFETICNEKLRSLKRKTSKQLRFIEMVQRRNELENLPGPASYSSTIPQRTNLNFLGTKAKRFNYLTDSEIPGPTRYTIKRDFEKYYQPIKLSHMKFLPTAAFGVNAVRFKYKPAEGPSPASYNSSYNPCKFQHCILAPFNSSTKRFKDDTKERDTDSDNEYISDPDETIIVKLKELPSWEFRSKTIRMQPTIKKLNEPSPADCPQPMTKIKRVLRIQHTSPFYSSKPRFQDWFNWIPVHGKEKTPGPGYYNTDKLKCLPAVRNGPICRKPRFNNIEFQTPAPNTYKIGKGIEKILNTHNQKLIHRIENQHKFYWSPSKEEKIFGLKEKESMLLNKCIALLDVPEDLDNQQLDGNCITPSKTEYKRKPKLLRCFVYANKIKQYF